jgi:hypothetical protein
VGEATASIPTGPGWNGRSSFRHLHPVGGPAFEDPAGFCEFVGAELSLPRAPDMTDRLDDVLDPLAYYRLIACLEGTIVGSTFPNAVLSTIGTFAELHEWVVIKAGH